MNPEITWRSHPVCLIRGVVLLGSRLASGCLWGLPHGAQLYRLCVCLIQGVVLLGYLLASGCLWGPTDGARLYRLCVCV